MLKPDAGVEIEEIDMKPCLILPQWLEEWDRGKSKKAQFLPQVDLEMKGQSYQTKSHMPTKMGKHLRSQDNVEKGM